MCARPACVYAALMIHSRKPPLPDETRSDCWRSGAGELAPRLPVSLSTRPN